MQLIFYKQAASPNRINKSNFLTTVGTIGSVEIKSDTDLMHPIFILRTNPVVYNSNYVYCEFTQRYYYIDSIDALSGNRIAIHCTIDVLHTYRNEILASTAWVTRSDSTTDEADDYDMLHNDYPFRQDFETRGVDFTGGDGVFDNTTLSANILFIIK